MKQVFFILILSSCTASQGVHQHNMNHQREYMLKTDYSSRKQQQKTRSNNRKKTKRVKTNTKRTIV